MAGDTNGNGHAAAWFRELINSQLVRIVSVCGAIAGGVWAAAGYQQKLETAWQPQMIEVKATLAGMQRVLDEQRKVLDTQALTLGKLVDFMDAENNSRRDYAVRSKLLRELCVQQALPAARCASLPSEGEIEALRR